MMFAIAANRDPRPDYPPRKENDEQTKDSTNVSRACHTGYIVFEIKQYLTFLFFVCRLVAGVPYTVGTCVRRTVEGSSPVLTLRHW